MECWHKTVKRLVEEIRTSHLFIMYTQDMLGWRFCELECGNDDGVIFPKDVWEGMWKYEGGEGSEGNVE